MVLKLYNTLTRKKENFVPLDKEDKKVGVYGCGPTVYWYQHIGNMRRYVFEDILIRTLIFNKYKVNHIINVTDVGHLTSDEDEGEDKIEKAAAKENKTAKEISEYYFSVFKNDLEKLNILMPDEWPKATENIKEQIEIVKILEKKGLTYKTSDGIYFDTSKLKNYGKLAKLDIKGLQKGKRVSADDKKNKTDFALWKFSNPYGEGSSKRQQEWKSPWGIGFPGWHIECSAMSSKYLGKQFDIHTGGIDHISVHHTNEIAQSECAFNVHPWVKYWLHSNHLILKKGKMSKSEGNILTISDLEKKGFSALDFRYLCLETHYRKKLIFSIEELQAAKNALQGLRNKISEFKDKGEINKEYLREFTEAINNDLNTPRALQVLWKFIRDKKVPDLEKKGTIKKFDEVLGLDLLKQEKTKIPAKIKKLISEREAARKKKDFTKSDSIREEIKKLGFVIEDTEKGVKIQGI
ncbi:cysteine--tRNA ligase [Candidatus Pacearchaeota archaeon]|nr:cysteine--tRNA ligase [Candidatus Pacearchaeota archaeon]